MSAAPTVVKLVIVFRSGAREEIFVANPEEFTRSIMRGPNEHSEAQRYFHVGAGGFMVRVDQIDMIYTP